MHQEFLEGEVLHFVTKLDNWCFPCSPHFSMGQVSTGEGRCSVCTVHGTYTYFV